MKITGFIFALIVSVSAVAHVEPGNYSGKTATGEDCGMIADVTTFENGQKHPLNERIKITVGSDVFVVGHPPVIDRAQAIAAFNHGAFQGVLPIKGGTKALVIDMSHEEGREGPTGFDLIEHEWKNPQGVKLECGSLKYLGPVR